MVNQLVEYKHIYVINQRINTYAQTMKRIVYKTDNFKDAEEWDILQQRQMTPELRQEIALELKKKVYGTKRTDVKDVHKFIKKKSI